MATKEITEKEKFPSNSQNITEEPRKFPNKYRFITEILLLSVGVIILAFFIIVLFSDLSRTYIQKAHQIAERRTIQQKIALWERIVATHPGYRDGNFMVAIYAYQIGDITTTKQYLRTTLSIDPNFTLAQTLQKVVQIRSIGE